MRKTSVTFGTLAIIFGSLELGGRVFVALLLDPLLKAYAAPVDAGTEAGQQAVAGHTHFTHAVFIVMSLALILLGVGLRRRRLWARRAAIYWSLAGLLFLVANTVYEFLVAIPAQRAAMAAVYTASHSRDDIAGFASLVISGATIAIFCIYAIFPALLLLFIGRRAAADDFLPAE